MAVGLDDVKRIHLIGVGGCSMSGIAEILKKQGHEVTGSDRERSQFTDRLEELGIPVSIPQKGEQVEGAELVIYSAAIKPDNPERAYAREHGIPEMERSVALGQISARYPHVAAISGCHGKTTITSMLAYINEEAKLDATVHVGGFVDLLNGGVKVGDGDLFITEACEYVRSFLTLVPTVALVNNIDNDHLDCYRDQQEIIETFAQFCALVPPEGEIIVCRDDEKVQRLLPLLDREPLTYGLSEGVKQRGDLRLSVSKLTFPHRLLHVMLYARRFQSLESDDHIRAPLPNNGRVYFVPDTHVRNNTAAALAHTVDFAELTVLTQKNRVFPKHTAGKERTLSAYACNQNIHHITRPPSSTSRKDIPLRTLHNPYIDSGRSSRRFHLC